MGVFLVLLTTLIVVTNGRPERTDDQNPPNVNTTITHCRTSFEVVYEEGQLPHPTCWSRCSRDEVMWFDGVVHARQAELEKYGLMLEITYINGTLQDCYMVPYETGEDVTARQEAQKRSMDSCSPIEDVSQDETVVLSQIEPIPNFPSTTPIHQILEGFSQVGDSSYLYRVSNDVMAWDDARPYCDKLGAALATVTQSQERNLLQGRLAAGVWTARDGISAQSSNANAGRTYLHTMCEHPLVDDLNRYSCPDDWWRYKSSCYLYSTNKYTYEEGETYCSLRGAYPVFINSQDEYDFLKGRIGWYTVFGYTDIEVEGTFVSKRFGLPLFTRWGPHEPNDANDGEDCVYLNNDMLWNDFPCTYMHRFLCERLAKIVV